MNEKTIELSQVISQFVKSKKEPVAPSKDPKDVKAEIVEKLVTKKFGGKKK